MTIPEDPARWTVDDDGEPRFGHSSMVIDLYGGITPAVHRVAFDALVADVRAARQHEGCTHTTDTLRQARELIENVDETAVSRDWVLGTHGAAQTFFTLGDLLDLLAAEGPNHG